MVGYQRGRVVAPAPDGHRDVTAHVAIDAVAAAGVGAGATGSLLLRQRLALERLGISGRRPIRRDTESASYLSSLAAAGAAAELLDRNGLGGFTWLAQAKGVDVPSVLRSQR
jgi:SAM-dependent MidA family methyltransferase